MKVQNIYHRSIMISLSILFSCMVMTSSGNNHWKSLLGKDFCIANKFQDHFPLSEQVFAQHER